MSAARDTPSRSSGATRKAILGDTCDRCHRYLHRGVKRREYGSGILRVSEKLCQRCRNELGLP